MKTYQYYRQTYLIHSKTISFKKKVEKAKDVIKQFLDLNVKTYTSFSGGKDSSALTHLVGSIDSSVQVMSQKDDMDFPSEKEFVSDFCKQLDLKLDIIEPEISLWSIIDGIDFTNDIHSKGTLFSDLYFYDLIRQYQKEKNFKGVFLGLRAQESNGRLWNFKKNKNIYYNQSWQQLVCQPLATWTAKDVFAYLFSNELPIMGIYFKTKFIGSPEKIRKSWILPSAQSETGQAQWLKYYYPEIYNRLSKVNSKIRNYV